MSTIESPRDRSLTLSEELANAISHGIGLLAALIAVPVLLVATVSKGDPWSIVGASVFSAAIIGLFASSTALHAFIVAQFERDLEVMDHIAIFFLIAGTYTPFTLGIMRGPSGWMLFGAVWALAIAGTVLKIVRGPTGYPILSNGLYLGMGWLILFAFGPLVERMPLTGVLLLLAGGLAYTVGIVFFIVKRLPYHHLIWHLFVMAGAALHFLAVLWYAS